MGFHQHLRRSMGARRAAASLLSGPAAAALALVATSGAAAQSEAQADQELTSPPTVAASAPGVEFVGVFLAKEAAKTLREKYPSKFATEGKDASASDEQLFVVLKYNPTAEEKDAFAPILGRDAKLTVQAYVEDDQTQAVLVAVTTETGEPIEFDAGGAEHPHVTVSSLIGQQGLNGAASSVLLERLRTSGKLQWLLETEEATDAKDGEASNWTGELPAFSSAHLPLFNPFPASAATVTAAAKDDSTLKGTVCLSSSFDPETGACMATPAKAECGFCKFMKAGPCGAEFTAWEACLDRCKQNGSDFIEHCGPQTLALRDCVDANPDYYHVLNEAPESEDADSEEASGDAAAAAPEPDQ